MRKIKSNPNKYYIENKKYRNKNHYGNIETSNPKKVYFTTYLENTHIESKKCNIKKSREKHKKFHKKEGKKIIFIDHYFDLGQYIQGETSYFGVFLYKDFEQI